MSRTSTPITAEVEFEQMYGEVLHAAKLHCIDFKEFSPDLGRVGLIEEVVRALSKRLMGGGDARLFEVQMRSRMQAAEERATKWETEAKKLRQQLDKKEASVTPDSKDHTNCLWKKTVEKLENDNSNLHKQVLVLKEQVFQKQEQQSDSLESHQVEGELRAYKHVVDKLLAKLAPL